MNDQINSGLGRLRYSIRDAATILGIGKTTIYSRIKEGKLNTVKDGSRALILREELERYAQAPDASTTDGGR